MEGRGRYFDVRKDLGDGKEMVKDRQNPGQQIWTHSEKSLQQDSFKKTLQGKTQ